MGAMAVPLSPALLAGGALRWPLPAAPAAPARGHRARGGLLALVSVQVKCCDCATDPGRAARRIGTPRCGDQSTGQGFGQFAL